MSRCKNKPGVRPSAPTHSWGNRDLQTFTTRRACGPTSNQNASKGQTSPQEGIVRGSAVPTKSDRTATLSAAGRQADQEYRSAAVQIKSGFPILQVSIYDGVSKS